jgi:hypothetical protein
MPSAGSQFKELGMMHVGPGGVRSPINLPATQGYDIYPQDRPRQPQQPHLMPHGVDPRNHMPLRYLAEGPAPGPTVPWGAQPGYPAPQRLIRAGPPAHHQMPPDYNYGAPPQRLVRVGPPRYADMQHGYESESSDDDSPRKRERAKAQRSAAQPAGLPRYAPQVSECVQQHT